jgi:hypothetical protein
MFEEVRDCFKFILLVNVSDDESRKIQEGNPMARIFSYYTRTRLQGHGHPQPENGLCGACDFEVIEQRVDLIIFGANVSSQAINELTSRFAQPDAILLFEADGGSISFDGLSATVAAGARVLSLHRLPGALVVGYDPGADFGTRTYAKLLSEFLSPLGRIVSGARVVIDGPFRKPDLVGNWFLVARAGVSFPPRGCWKDVNLVAVDLSRSRITSLQQSVFSGCGALAAVSFPSRLAVIGQWCFQDCTALHDVDLSTTCVTRLDYRSFARSGVICLSLPATLEVCDVSAFESSGLKKLDLSVCARVKVLDLVAHSGLAGPPGIGLHGIFEMGELRLPRSRVMELAGQLLPGSRVEVLEADVDAAEAKRLLQNLTQWGIDRLRIVSRRLDAPFEWRGVSTTLREALTDPARLVRPSDVFLTAWRKPGEHELCFLRSIDMSALSFTEFPQGATWWDPPRLSGCTFLERAILPAALHALPGFFFHSCWRLSHVCTAGCTALEEIGWYAFAGCRSLKKFDFPSTIRTIGGQAFFGTAIAEIDLLETAAESVEVGGMAFLKRLILPRRCVLDGMGGLPALRSLTFGRALNGDDERERRQTSTSVRRCTRFDSRASSRRWARRSGWRAFASMRRLPPSSAGSRTSATPREPGWACDGRLGAHQSVDV